MGFVTLTELLFFVFCGIVIFAGYYKKMGLVVGLGGIMLVISGFAFLDFGILSSIIVIIGIGFLVDGVSS